jgi:integrase
MGIEQSGRESNEKIEIRREFVEQSALTLTRNSSGSSGGGEKRYFKYLANKALEIEDGKLQLLEITEQTHAMFVSRLNRYLVPYFGELLAEEINYQKLTEFIAYLRSENIGAVTIKQYMGLLKRILTVGLSEGIITQVPIIPRVKAKSVPRGSFTVQEYSQILRAAKDLSRIVDKVNEPTHRNTASGAFIKTESVPKEIIWMIGFMVNTFVRPVDIKLIKHKHIEIVRGEHDYLRITLPETKKHAGQIVSMRAAVRIYDALRKHQMERGYGESDDWLFLPQVRDRQSAIQLISGHFRKVLLKLNLERGRAGQVRTLYSLRHTAITFRLLYGKGIDLLTLARNARTSVEMIERFYSSNLTAEMNIGMLQSKRTS